METGTFTHIYHPNKENLFENATIDVIVFRYCNSKILTNKIIYNGETKYLLNTNGILTIVNNQHDNDNNNYIKNNFHVYVGMVTGRESVFKNEEFSNFNMLNKENKIDKYILIESFPTKNEGLNEYLLKHKNELMKRKIKKFNENNWFEWGALRNKKNIEKYMNKDCIYISNLTRNEKPAFIGKVQFFGGSLLILIPKKKINLNKIVEHLNSDDFKKNYTYSGRFKIGHRQLCNYSIPKIHYNIEQ